MASREDTKKSSSRFTKIIIGIIGFFVILIGCGFGVNAYTSSPTFCKSCHEMQPEYATYSESVHKNINCVKCHDKPGIQNIIPNKVRLIKEVYTHFTGVPKQIVVKNLDDVPTENCLQCHTKTKLVKATGDLIVNHPGHILKDEIPCITCHAGISHGKIAARGLNIAENRSKITQLNAVEIMAKKDVKPNMGTCIDCHDKVNHGEKPWKDNNYVIPPLTQNSTIIGVTDNIAQDQKTQELILQAIGKQKANVKISMGCKTCHKIVNIPIVHKNMDWQVNHGNMAMQELDKCLTCHQDSKWVKAVPKENVTSIVDSGNQKANYITNYLQVKEQSRVNQFCKACHSNEPPSHTQSFNWSTEHAEASSTDEEKSNCYICHDSETPKQGSTVPKAPASSCQSCHQYFEK
ncbi:MAG: NapC/NirT family cytochrome c [Bacillota bacterium]|nr:NapC/NirT family cytochrome c [Bacillota bacterium]